MIHGDGGRSGSPLLHSGLVAGDGLGRVHTSTVAVHTLKIGVAQCGEGRYPPGGVEGEELLHGREDKKKRVNINDTWLDLKTQSTACRSSCYPPLTEPVLAHPCLEPSSLLV